jgi:hypothetical protein
MNIKEDFLMTKQQIAMKAYYERHKDDPEFKAKQKATARRYYELNREKIKAKANARHARIRGDKTPEFKSVEEYDNWHLKNSRAG